MLLSTAKYLVLSGLSFSVIFPMVGVFFAAFKQKGEYFLTSSMAPPENIFNFENFESVFHEGHIPSAFLNTGIMIISACLFSTILCTMVAYVFSRFEFRGKALIDKLYTAASFIPGVIVHLIIYRDFAVLHLNNRLISVILLYSGVDIISLYLYRQYFDQISHALDESAMLDGCTYLQIYVRILLPIVKPAIITACILKTIAMYNDFYTASLYLGNIEKTPVMSTVFYNFIGLYSSEWNKIAAGVLIISLPVFMGFILMQKYIYKGFADGAVKG